MKCSIVLHHQLVIARVDGVDEIFSPHSSYSLKWKRRHAKRKYISVQRCMFASDLVSAHISSVQFCLCSTDFEEMSSSSGTFIQKPTWFSGKDVVTLNAVQCCQTVKFWKCGTFPKTKYKFIYNKFLYVTSVQGIHPVWGNLCIFSFLLDRQKHSLYKFYDIRNFQ